MNYKNLCEKIIYLVGGKDNIQNVVHCVTRLRFTLTDQSLADIDKILELKEVIDVIANEAVFQIVIGPQVMDVYKDFMKLLGDGVSQDVTVKKNIWRSVLDLMSESMSPILQPLMAAGMLAGVLSILSLTGIISAESSTYMIIDSLRNAIFYFLPVFMAMSCAKKLNANPYLAVALAVTLLSTGINGVEGLNLFGIPLPTITYSNSFFPIILAVWLMGNVDKVLSRIIPNAITYFFKPVLTLLICLPVTLLLFGPMGTWLGDGINLICQFLMSTVGNWIVVALYAALQPFLIMFGAANFVMPVLMNFLTTQGYDPIFLVGSLISDAAVGGELLGYFLRSKNSQQKQLFGTTAFSAFMNITEPGIYGVFVKFRRPFFAVMIGGGLGGMFAGLMGVKGYSFAGLVSLTAWIGDGDYRNFYCAIIAVVIAIIGAGIASYFLGIPDTDEENSVQNKKRNLEIHAPVEGKVISLTDVEDKAFASEALGKGIAFMPEEDMIYAPVSGEVVTLFPTQHAIGLKTDYGIEVLIHIGIDTVELNGKYFKSFIKQGDHVHIGQEMIHFDREAISKEGFDNTVIMVITNSHDYLDIVPTNENQLSLNQSCLTVVLS